MSLIQNLIDELETKKSHMNSEINKEEIDEIISIIQKLQKEILELKSEYCKEDKIPCEPCELINKIAGSEK